MKKPVRALIALLVLALGAAAVLWVAPVALRELAMRRHYRQAAAREPQALVEWAREFGSPSDLIASYPRQENDETARRLVQLAEPLGIHLPVQDKVISDEPDRRTPEEKETAQAIWDYVLGELKAVGAPVAPPPTIVSDYLERHGGEIRKVVELLASSPSPAWKMDAGREPEPPVPNLLGQLGLQRRLVAEALRQEAAGDYRQVERILDASWNLNASLRDRPEIVSQIISISVARMQAGLLRRASASPAKWQARLEDHDYRSSLIRAFVLEEARFLRHPGTSLQDRAAVADYLDGMRLFYTEVKRAPVSDRSRDDLTQRLTSSSDPLSAFTGRISLPNEMNSFCRADQLAVERELTRKILEARALKLKEGAWPRQIPGIESSLIPDAHWTYSVTPSGRMTIELSRELHWPCENPFLVVPSGYESDSQASNP